MDGPVEGPGGPGATDSRSRFEDRYRDALADHFRAPSDRGLAAAHDLGEQALAEGISILDVVTTHMTSRRGLFPGVGDQFAVVDDFLRESMTAFERLRRTSARLRTTRDVAAELSQATTRRGVAAVMLAAVMELSEAQAGAIALYRGATRGRARRADLLATLPADDARRVRTLGGAARAVDDLLQPFEVLELSSPEEVEHAIGAKAAAAIGAVGLAAHPIVWRGRIQGVLLVAWSDRRRFARFDRDQAAAPVLIGAAAMERAERYDTDHEIALTLQRGMLSIPMFDVPETTWSAHYSSAATGLVGGDWYDVIDLDERVGFSVGDIVGRGTSAAVEMGQVRSAARALANCFDKPHEVIGGLDHFVAATGVGMDSSMAFVSIDRRSGELGYAVAGHPPPLVLSPRGDAVWLDDAGGALLGRGGPRVSASILIEPGTSIVLYTDGLIERRDEALDEGMARLVDAARTVTADEDRANRARRLAAVFSSRQAIDDDVAVLFVTYTGA
jgi:stage II sporulation SpoE-like protein/phosphoserine phosphatase RsbU-like protein